jgi:hypothetical protein
LPTYSQLNLAAASKPKSKRRKLLKKTYKAFKSVTKYGAYVILVGLVVNAIFDIANAYPVFKTCKSWTPEPAWFMTFNVLVVLQCLEMFVMIQLKSLEVTYCRLTLMNIAWFIFGNYLAYLHPNSINLSSSQCLLCSIYFKIKLYTTIRCIWTAIAGTLAFASFVAFLYVSVKLIMCLFKWNARRI